MKVRGMQLAVFCLGPRQQMRTYIQFWPVSPTGDFTLNHFYDFNDPGAQPFGSFGPMAAQSVPGVS